jgi:hypothetical protein
MTDELKALAARIAVVAFLLGGCQSRIEQAGRFCPLICNKTVRSLRTTVDERCNMACVLLALSVTDEVAK